MATLPTYQLPEAGYAANTLSPGNMGDAPLQLHFSVDEQTLGVDVGVTLTIHCCSLTFVVLVPSI